MKASGTYRTSRDQFFIYTQSDRVEHLVINSLFILNLTVISVSHNDISIITHGGKHILANTGPSSPVLFYVSDVSIFGELVVSMLYILHAYKSMNITLCPD